ncbi:hypothetical protein DV735_g1066, partial [Chaetothyriales sp. CBS 134920]
MVRRVKPDEYTAKNRLTLDELAAHDDVCSDVLIDNAYYKARIRKNKPKHIPVRGIKEDEIPQILLHHVIVAKDVVAAEKAIMRLPGLVRYFKGLRNKQKQDNFLAHLRKFIYMYQTDCPFEISTTNRYTITSYEAAVTARRRIKQGEYIKYLTGTLVPLTTEESINLDLTNRNFSIVVTGRKKSDQIFLGPARFANHDCDSNARLVMKGTESMEVIAVKNIEVGEEITVSYGDNYFGPNNAECLCHTCELEERNGWTSPAAAAQPKAASSTPEAEPDRSGRKTAKKRKRDGSATPPKLQRNGLKRLKTLASPSKLQYSWTPPSTSESDITQEDADIPLNARPSSRSTPSGIQDPKQNLAIPPISSKTAMQLPKSFPPTPSATSNSGQECELDTLAEATELLQTPQPVTIKLETVEKTTVENDQGKSIHATGASDDDDQDPLRLHSSPISTPQSRPAGLPSPPQTVTPFTITKVSTLYELPPDESDSGSELLSITAASTAPTIIPSIEPAPRKPKSRTSVGPSDAPTSAAIRIPGDYILTRKLLAQPHDRWEKRNGPGRPREQGASAQPKYSAYRRQGRAGKGSWVEGGGDEEERVMDHRTIHRFVLPEEERELSRKGLLVEAEEARRLGDGWLALARLDGRAERLRNGEGRESTGRESSETLWASTPEGEDEEGRRRSNRIVENRVYVNVDMKSKMPSEFEDTPDQLGSTTERTALLKVNTATDTGLEPPLTKDVNAPLPMFQILCLCYVRVYEPIAFFCIFPFINLQITSLPLQDPPIPDTSVGFYSGLIESLFSLTQMIFMLFWGIAADHPRIGRKPVLVFSLIGVSFCMAGFGFSRSVWQMIIWRCCAGVFGGTIVTIRTMISENSTPKNQAKAFSYFAFTGNLGIFLGPLIGGALADPVKQYPSLFGNSAFFAKYPYSLPTMVTGAIGLSTALVTILFVKETLPIKDGKLLYRVPTKEKLGTWQLLKSPGVGMVLFIYTYVMVLAFSYTAVTPVFYFEPVSKSGLGFSPLTISLVLASAGLSQSVWILAVFPVLQERFSTGFVLRLCAAFYPALFAVYPLLNFVLKLKLTSLFWTLFIPVNLIGPGVSMVFTAIQLCLNDINPHPSTLGSLNALAVFLACGIRAMIPGAFTSLYAIGVEKWILNGYLVWLVLVVFAIGLGVVVKRLPEAAEGNIQKWEDENETA